MLVLKEGSVQQVLYSCDGVPSRLAHCPEALENLKPGILNSSDSSDTKRWPCALGISHALAHDAHSSPERQALMPLLYT